ncbi:MAG: IreB family regulatory phosphoprotein [Bacilli bacterium]|nr:IreB family regulatory phosphoprotein [Bacilli bacterium]
MDNEKTNVFDVKNINDIVVKQTIYEAVEALEERGYNPINQLVGYIISGDPGYISNYKETRTKLSKIDRADIVEVLLRDYINVK